MAKFCGNCGTQLEDNAKICGKCGTPLDGASANIPGLKVTDPEKQNKENGQECGHSGCPCCCGCDCV